VAIAAWDNAISARGARPNLSVLLLNDASAQNYIIFLQQCIVSVGQRCIVATCHGLKEKKENNKERKGSFGGELISEKETCKNND
jgi:hypothetical protein